MIRLSTHPASFIDYLAIDKINQYQSITDDTISVRTQFKCGMCLRAIRICSMENDFVPLTKWRYECQKLTAYTCVYVTLSNVYVFGLRINSCANALILTNTCRSHLLTKAAYEWISDVSKSYSPWCVYD